LFQATALDGQLAGLQKELGGQKQAALCQENSLLALQTALATAEKKAALQVDPIVKERKECQCDAKLNSPFPSWVIFPTDNIKCLDTVS
jgi:hypothetical protein